MKKIINNNFQILINYLKFKRTVNLKINYLKLILKNMRVKYLKEIYSLGNLSLKKQLIKKLIKKLV